jgi:hypothetical protein
VGCGIDPSLELEYFDALEQTYGYRAFLGPNGGLTLLNRNGKGSLFFVAK